MISAVLASRARRHGARELLRDGRGSLGYQACHEEGRRLSRELGLSAGARVGLAGLSGSWLLVRLAAIEALGACAYLLPPGLGDSQARALVADQGLEVLLSEPDGREGGSGAGAPPGQAGVVIFTSGTTGRPRAALHSWGSLAGRVHRRQELEGSRWLLTFGLTTFAGLQVLLHALHNGGTLVIGDGGPAEQARLGREAGVTHASGTPSFFRLLLSTADPADLSAWPLKQVTLGGEAADQVLLDALRRRFPRARLTQIYASTEMGVCFSVHDGQAGFPAAYLDRRGPGPLLRVVDGELCVASGGAMRGYVSGSGLQPPPRLFPTGDMVEVQDGRVRFLGRRGERINVGGQDTFPGEIEKAVLEVPGVRAVRVSGAPSSLVGQLVRAEVVLDGVCDAPRARRRILEHCRRRLRAHEVPRLFDFVTALEHTANGKLVRD